MKLIKLTTMSNKNINSIFEHYPKELNYEIDTTFIKSMYNLIHTSDVKEDKVIKENIQPHIVSPFMSNEIRDFIDNHTWNQYSACYRIENMNVNVCLYSHTHIQPTQYMFFIKLVLTMCTKAATVKHTEINIKVVLATNKKKYPNAPIQPANINGGHTDPNKNEIVIFRKEEWFKVFIHECFHLFMLDFCDTTIDFTRIFKPMYNVDSKFLLFEVLTEFWARIMNLSIVSYYTKDQITYDEFKQVMNINLQIERLYSIAQMNHLLGRMGYTYQDLISFNKPILKEKTNFFCYYVLTSVMFFYLNDTMKWLLINHSFIQFSKNKVYPFTHYIKQHHNRADFLQYIKLLDKPLYNSNMSAFEILF